ncbi:MAG: type I restriction enzyme HsdR N-terminal domain-containing protein [Bacteroidales bacterium]|nr:type I restriction enzyme HsdR N-terminal domain-containing protein [Bacteroidales bacterium]
MELEIDNGKIYAPLKEKWLVLKPEEEVRQKYINRLIDKYGFTVDQMAQEVQVSNSQRGQGRAMADIVIWRTAKDKNESNSPAIVVECKAEHITGKRRRLLSGI